METNEIDSLKPHTQIKTSYKTECKSYSYKTE